MMQHVALAAGLIALVGCGSTGSSGASTTATDLREAEQAAEAERAERERRSGLAAAHRKLEDEQATALAGTCETPPAHVAEKRCTPSCYRAEAVDARSSKKVAGAAEIMHLVCTRAASPDSFLIMDEIGGAQLEVRAVHRKVPKGNK